MSRTHKWPAKALNLLVALAMVISLCVVFAPVVAATPDGYFDPAVDECDPTKPVDGCDLDVFVNLYTKDASGDFTRLPEVEGIPTIDVGDCFYVNAVVLNVGNVSTTAIDGPAGRAISATISGLDPTITLLSTVSPYGACDELAEKFWRVQGALTTENQVLAPAEMADFWWKVCCIGAATLQTITVTAVDIGACGGVGTVTINQIVPPEEKCVEVKIIEAPGLTILSGDTGWYDEDYPLSPLPQMIAPCTNFGIKAKITNNCLTTLYNVNGTIRWGQDYNPLTDEFGLGGISEDTNLDGVYASIVGVDPLTWCVGNLAPGESAIVAWTLHCDAPGDIEILVQAFDDACTQTGTTLHPITTYINDYWDVYQMTPGGLEVVITDPLTCTKQPSGCDNTFTVYATVYNTGDEDISGVDVYFTANDTALLDFVYPDRVEVGLLEANSHEHVSLGAECLGPGDVDIEVMAKGSGVPDSAMVVESIHQQEIIVEQFALTQRVAPLDPVGDPLESRLGYEGQVNVCQDFQVIYRFSNYTDDALSDVLTTINWTGPAWLTDGVEFRRISQGGTPGPWQAWAGNAGPLTPVYDTDHWEWSDTLDDSICACCCTDVRWTFKCNNTTVLDGNVTIWAEMEVGELYDITGLLDKLVYQEWKAHLVSGVAAFLQNDCGAMLNRDAFTPCQDFHFVIPVVNTGDADAQDVTIQFIVDGIPTDATWSLVSITGDVVGTPEWDPGTGIGNATLGTIAGNTTKKVIVQLHCEGEGQVTIWVPEAPLGLHGIDENTGEAIPEANIQVPDCAYVVDQVPFTVEIINPVTCESYNEGDRFAVKAIITNDSSTDLGNVSATIYWEGPLGVPYGNAQLQGDTYPVSPPYTPDQTIQNLTKVLGNNTNHTVVAGSVHEITWELECTAPGEVYIWVDATSLEPSLTATSDDDPLVAGNQPVNIHQTYMSDVVVEILSPMGGNVTYIATSQEFAVTARVSNTGGAIAESVTASLLYADSSVTGANGVTRVWTLAYPCITPGTVVVYFDGVLVSPANYSVDYLTGTITFSTAPPTATVILVYYLYQVSVVAATIDGVPVGSAGPTLTLGDLDPDERMIVTWTLHADTTCVTQCLRDALPICVWAETTSAESDYTNNAYCKWIELYPAAHLVVDIGAINTTIGVCDEFVVPFTVTNTGEADAWEVSATLSVTPEGSVRIAEGAQGYTQYIGTLTGWGIGDTYSGTFNLHCKLACESTITITAAGFDECGWEIKQLCDLVLPNGNGDSFVCALYPHNQPGLPIPERFIEPDFVTVKQLLSGGLDLGITKTVDDAYPALEQVVTFTITVTNNGPTDASGVEVTDSEPTGLTFGTAVATQGTYSAGVWDVGSLVTGASATLTIPATVDSAAEITNTAEITAVDQPDGFPQNDSASVTLNAAAVTSVVIDLDEGWNLISMPLIPTNNSLETMLTPVWGDFIRAFKYDACTPAWTSYVKGGPSPSLTTLDDGFGYWILMDDEGTITVSGVVALDPPNLPPSYPVCEGWDLIGFKSTTAMAAGEYLAALQAAGVPTWTRVWGFANGMYSVVQSGDMMTPGFGYWLAVLADGTIYP